MRKPALSGVEWAKSNGFQPDFKTIADFRWEKVGAFKKVFRQFHLLCRDPGLLGGEVVTIDGTKL